MTRNKNWLFGRHFETVQHFIFFSELWFLIVHTYMVQFLLQNSVRKAVFLGGSWTPFGTNGSKSTLVTYVLSNTQAFFNRENRTQK